MRREELKHAQDIREMYEEKLRRATKIYSELQQCLNYLAAREQVFCSSGFFSFKILENIIRICPYFTALIQELLERERHVNEREKHTYNLRIKSNILSLTGMPKSFKNAIVRMRPESNDMGNMTKER